MKKIFLVVLLAVFAFSGCEKDDICDGSSPTTPRLIVEFYDVNTGLLRPVDSLKVIAPGMEVPVILAKDANGEPIYVVTASKAAVPLKTLDDSTQLTFISNSGSATLELSDELEFNYQTATEYVSRACGFKTSFLLNPETTSPRPVILNGNPANTSGNWIKNIEIVKSNIEAENEVHLKIFY